MSTGTQLEGLIQANGRIEGDQVTVASKFAGRVAHLAVREGATVRRGDLIAVLDDAQASARVDQTHAGVAEAGGTLAQANARLGQAEAAVWATDAKIAASNTALEVLEGETAIRAKEAEAGLDHARAVLVHAENAEAQARRDLERYKRLSDQGDVEARRGELAEQAFIAAQSDLTAAKSQLIRAEQQLKDAQLGPQRVRAKQDEIRALEAQRSMDRATVAQAQAALEQAQATVRHAEAGHREAITTKADLTISAPTDGVVMTRTTEEGEVVAAGSALVTVVDLDRLYLRVFVPEAQIGMLRLGLRAQIYTDAFPDKSFPATVRYISSRAEFTPREVQSPEERVKLVYAVKLYLDANPDHKLTPGLPADAMIRWKDGVPWTRPRW
jgi:HlyD family secretion protein